MARKVRDIRASDARAVDDRSTCRTSSAGSTPTPDSKKPASARVEHEDPTGFVAHQQTWIAEPLEPDTRPHHLVRLPGAPAVDTAAQQQVDRVRQVVEVGAAVGRGEQCAARTHRERGDAYCRYPSRPRAARTRSKEVDPRRTRHIRCWNHGVAGPRDRQHVLLVPA